MNPDLGPHCLPVCKNRFEKFARIFSRRQKQTTVSDAGFLGVLRVNNFCDFLFVFLCIDPNLKRGLLKKEIIGSHSTGSQFFPFKEDPFSEGENNFDSYLYGKCSKSP